MQILRENWKLYVERSQSRSYFHVRDWRYKQSKLHRCERKVYQDLLSVLRGLGQPAISTAPPGTFAHSLGRLAFQTSAVEGGQTRLTGCHGDLMDWSEQISSPKTPERIAGFQRIASASARWVSFRPSFFLSSFLRSPFHRTAHILSGKKNVWGNLENRSLHHIIIAHDCLSVVKNVRYLFSWYIINDEKISKMLNTN